MLTCALCATGVSAEGCSHCKLGRGPFCLSDSVLLLSVDRVCTVAKTKSMLISASRKHIFRNEFGLTFQDGVVGVVVSSCVVRSGFGVVVEGGWRVGGGVVEVWVV